MQSHLCDSHSMSETTSHNAGRRRYLTACAPNRSTQLSRVRRYKPPMFLFELFVRAVAQATDRRGVLGEDEIVFPPESDFGYESTPRNALTFGAMGVDGVHFAILKIAGAVTDESPVIHIS